jgi:hypothetical protein
VSGAFLLPYVLLLAEAIAPHPGPSDGLGSRSLRVSATAPQLFELATQLEAMGNFDKAGSILTVLESDSDPNIRNEARYRHALLLGRLGQHRDAAILLRHVVDESPAATAARLQLAATLQALGDEEAAWRELRAIRSTELPPTVARFVDRVSASLQANKPFGVQVELSVAPDSNINRATRSDTLGTVIGDFTIDDGSKAKSGLGAALRGMAHARLDLSESAALQARAGTEAHLYRDKDFNDIALDLSAGPEFSLGPSRLGFELGAVQRWYGMEPYQRGLRAAAYASVPVDSVSRARLDLSGRKVDDRLNNLQDGKGFAFRLRYERALSPQLLVSAGFGVERFKARDDAYSTKGWAAQFSAYRDIGRTTLSAGVDIGRLWADERLTLLPDAREDNFLRLQLGLVNRKLTVAGFAPMSRLVMERNKSTIEFYDYKRTRMEFGITRAF